MILGFRRKVAENCALLGYYAASSENFLPTFRDNLSVPNSGFKNQIAIILTAGPCVGISFTEDKQ